MVTKKIRRHSGYITPRATISKKDLIKYGLFLNPFYDDWINYGDGFRGWYKDFKKIKKPHLRKCGIFYGRLLPLYEKRIKMNLKQKMLLTRRKLRKNIYK